MATLRRAGFGSVFEVENETVGIGTTGTATNTLQVLGDIVTSDATIIGISSIPSYQGFVDKKAKFGKALVDNNSESGSINDIVIEGDFTVSSATTFCSSLNQLTLTNSFSVPTGDTNSRIHCQTAGSMRFNEEFGTLEFYTGDEWRTVNSYNKGSSAGRALLFGGYSEPSNSNTLAIDVVTISTLGNATRFGQMDSSGDTSFGIGNETRGIYHRGGSSSDTLEYVTTASEGNPIDFGNLSQARYLGARGNSSTRGIFLSGLGPSSSYKNNIDYVEMGTLGNALDFGDVNTSVFLNNNSVNSTVRVYSLGGYASPGVNISKIEYVTISSKGDALEFDDLDRPNSTFPGFANNVRGIYGGGNLRPFTSDQIFMFNTASQGKMIFFGELTQRRKEFAGSCSQTRGIFAGGQLDPNGPSTINIIDFVTIATTGDAQDFGDLSKTPRNFTSLSDSHGGLGGN